MEIGKYGRPKSNSSIFFSRKNANIWRMIEKKKRMDEMLDLIGILFFLFCSLYHNGIIRLSFLKDRIN